MALDKHNAIRPTLKLYCEIMYLYCHNITDNNAKCRVTIFLSSTISGAAQRSNRENNYLKATQIILTIQISRYS